MSSSDFNIFPLTHQECESLKKSVLAYKLESNLNDDDLIRKISSLLTTNKTGIGLERVFYNHTLDLINFLRGHQNCEASYLARGALFHILSTYNNSIPRPSLLEIQERSFVASFAVSEIKNTNAISFASEHSVLDQKEKLKAEEMLLEFMDDSVLGDEELCSHAMKIIKENSLHRTTGIISRFQDNLRFLSDVIDGDKWNMEQKNWARGALSYVHIEDDLISDNLGIIGLLDDIYVVQTAADLILPERPPWIELISDLQHAWPFLRDIVLEYQNQEYSFSDFSLVNTALICPELRDNKNGLKTILVLPSSGIVPFSISLCAVFGTIYSSVKIKFDDIDFKVNQKVLVDNNAVAIFDGLDQLGDETFIRLKQFNVEKGQKLETINRIPVHEVSRLCPASSVLKTHGKISTRLNTTDVPLSAIERLLHLQYPFQFSNIKGRVWLISISSNIYKLIKEISIYGQKLLDVFPVAHVKRDGSNESWSRRFGETDSLLTVISDLDLAVDFIEDQKPTKDDFIIIDMAGVNSSRISALEILKTFDARVLCVIEEKNASLISNLDSCDFDCWEWVPDQARKLLSQAIRESKLSTHPFNENDVRASRGYSLGTNENILSCNEAEMSFNQIYDLTHYVKSKKGEVPYDLDRIYDILIGVFVSLTRNIFQPLESEFLLKEHKIKLDDVEKIYIKSVFLTEDEKKLCKVCIEGLYSLVDEMKVENLKANYLKIILDSNPDAKILLPASIKSLNLDKLGALQTGLYVTIPDLENMDIKVLIIPFWPGKDRVWKLISRPVVETMHYVLYEFESKWKQQFEYIRSYQRMVRQKPSNNALIFPLVKNWPVRKEEEKSDQPVYEDVKSNDLIELRNQRRTVRFIGEVNDINEEAVTQASIVVFQGWGYAFLTDTFEAHVVTHLFLGELNGENKAVVKNKSLKDLVSGDVLVFLRGTSKDAIKDIADTNMPEGTREVATLWQKALRKKICTGLINYENLRDDLEKAGCKRHIVTIKHWIESDNVIGPHGAQNGAIELIAAITGDMELNARVNDCKAAISLVLSEHLRAATTIAKQVLVELHTRNINSYELDEPLEIGNDMILVSIDYINHDLICVPKSKCNHLLENS